MTGAIVKKNCSTGGAQQVSRWLLLLIALLVSGCQMVSGDRGLVEQRIIIAPESEQARSQPAVIKNDSLKPVTQKSVVTKATFSPLTTSNGQFAIDDTATGDFADELDSFFLTLKADATGLANWNNAALFGIALGGSVGLRQSVDGKVRRTTARHPKRWGSASRHIGRLADPQYQLAALLLLRHYGRSQSDAKFQDFTDSLFNAWALTGLGTLAMKGIANTDRPSIEWNSGQFGFPSYHASSSFSIAAVVDEYYGARAGLPAYLVAGLISWSRIDERDHDLSDIAFGAALGYLIGKSVAGRHLYCDGRVRILPFVHPTDGSSGLMLDVSF